MKIVEDDSYAARRDRWTDACSVAAFLSFVLIVGHVLCPLMAGVSMAYSGGGAVVLGIGATLCLALKSGAVRIASSMGLVCLMILRALSPIKPDLFAASHGELSTVDASGLALLIFTASLMVYAATRSSSSGPRLTEHSTGATSCAGG